MKEKSRYFEMRFYTGGSLCWNSVAEKKFAKQICYKMGGKNYLLVINSIKIRDFSLFCK